MHLSVLYHFKLKIFGFWMFDGVFHAFHILPVFLKVQVKTLYFFYQRKESLKTADTRENRLFTVVN